MKQKLAAGDTETAMKLAGRHWRCVRRTKRCRRRCCNCRRGTRIGRAPRARLAAALKSRQPARDVHKRRDAVVGAGSCPRRNLAEGKIAEAIRDAEAANRYGTGSCFRPPSWRRGSPSRRQAKVGDEDGSMAPWANTTQHPDIAAAFAEIEPARNVAGQRLKRVSAAAQHPGHPEARMLRRAELADAPRRISPPPRAAHWATWPKRRRSTAR